MKVKELLVFLEGVEGVIDEDSEVYYNPSRVGHKSYYKVRAKLIVTGDQREPGVSLVFNDE